MGLTYHPWCLKMMRVGGGGASGVGVTGVLGSRVCLLCICARLCFLFCSVKVGLGIGMRSLLVEVVLVLEVGMSRKKKMTERGLGTDWRGASRESESESERAWNTPNSRTVIIRYRAYGAKKG